MDWFRWHHGSVTDPKFQLVARKSGASLPDVLAVWAFLLERASSATERGCFGCIDADALDCLFNFPATETRTADILRVLEERGLIADGWIARWEERQPKREREDDKSTSRVQAFRERKRQETPSNAVQSQETPRLDKSREEEKKEEKTGASALLLAKGIPEDLTRDFLAMRKTQKAPFTETALAGFEREAKKAGLSLEQAVRESTERSWRGFKAIWMQEQARGSATAQTGRHTDTAADTRRMLDEQTKDTKPMPAELRGVVAQLTGRKAA
jgi:hypothetical protein